MQGIPLYLKRCRDIPLSDAWLSAKAPRHVGILTIRPSEQDQPGIRPDITGATPGYAFRLTTPVPARL